MHGLGSHRTSRYTHQQQHDLQTESRHTDTPDRGLIQDAAPFAFFVASS